ncbi:hypothetical protein QQF64_016086 [Cirrhinus molitorella]|uniref:Uncharacterized protein n=2 Tax=Cirrhinus molitorella TaxID=172907 RepID=A0AA88PK59_9TELE|nr:hypothetical protein Q8A67_017712 [Cirrhinus molitorella]
MHTAGEGTVLLDEVRLHHHRKPVVVPPPPLLLFLKGSLMETHSLHRRRLIFLDFWLSVHSSPCPSVKPTQCPAYSVLSASGTDTFSWSKVL